MLAWVVGTGTTWTSRSYRGHNAGPADVHHAFKVAAGATIFGGPVLVFLVLRRGRGARQE